MKNNVLSGIMGLTVADALGVPVEFKSRRTLESDPVTSMQAYGTYNQPAGTWSDDTSMTLGLVDSLAKGLDYENIMKNFSEWLYEAEYTPHGEVFDVGIGTNKALDRFKAGVPALKCGGALERDNGNGSLMRILPIYYYLKSIYGNGFLKNEESFEIIHNVSALTHAHKRSQIACGIYISIASELANTTDLDKAVKDGIYLATSYYQKRNEFVEELNKYNRLEDIADLPIEEIKSSGYVVDTLEAAVWCLLTTKSYQECVLKAVNLGEDTDTVAAVAGGLAGIYYGYESIPDEWLDVVVKREYVEELCGELTLTL